MGLPCLSLIATDVAFSIDWFFSQVSVQIFHQVFTWGVLLSREVRVLFLSAESKFFYQLYTLEISSPNPWPVFSFSWQYLSLKDRSIYILMKFCFIKKKLSLMTYTFWSFVWNLYLTQDYKDFLLHFLLEFLCICDPFRSIFYIWCEALVMLRLKNMSSFVVKKTFLSPLSYIGTFVKKQ